MRVPVWACDLHLAGEQVPLCIILPWNHLVVESMCYSELFGIA